MSEERGLIEPLSARLPHSFKHHIRYLNRSFWQERQGQTFSFSRPIDVLYFPPPVPFSFSFCESRTAVSYVSGMLDSLNHQNNLFAPLWMSCYIWESEQSLCMCHLGRIDVPASLLKTCLRWHWSWLVPPSLWWDSGHTVCVSEFSTGYEFD